MTDQYGERGPWHSGDENPEIDGVYEVMGEDGSPFKQSYPSYAYYAKKTGWTTATDFEYAFTKYIGWGAPWQKKQWRGLAKKPKENHG